MIASQWAVGGAAALSLAFLAAGPWLIDQMTTAQDVRDEARLYYLWAAAAPVLGVASWMLDGVFIGATWTRAMRIAMMISVATYVVALAVLVPNLGNHGLWLALMILNVTRAVTLALRYPGLERQIGAHS